MTRATRILTSLVAAAFALAVGPAAASASSPAHAAVFGGSTVPTAKYPFMVRLESADGNAFCSGSLVNPTHVVTAAHCFDSDTFVYGLKRRWSNLRVRFANTAERTAVPAKRATIWRNWSSFEPGNDNRVGTGYPVHLDQADVAVVELSANAPDSVTPVAMAPIAESGRSDELAIVGYGPSATGAGTLREEAAEAPLQLASASTCRLPMGSGNFEPFDSREICVNSTPSNPTAEACRGDSGGALLALKPSVALVGVTSWGTPDDNCSINNPTPGWSVFASVSGASDWLAQQTGTAVGGATAAINLGRPKPAKLSTRVTACKGSARAPRCSIKFMRLRVKLADSDASTIHSRATIQFSMLKREGSGSDDFQLGKFYVEVPLSETEQLAEIPVPANWRSWIRKHSTDRRLHYQVEVRSYNRSENGSSTIIVGKCSVTGQIRCSSLNAGF